MMRITGAQALVKSVLSYGVDTIFGLPGGQLDNLFDALYKEGDSVRVIHSRHEQGCAYMAMGYARSTGRVGVYTVVPGAGLLNTTAALSTAYATNAQVLCLAGQIPSKAIGKGFGELHEIPDQLALIRGLTKWAQRIDHPGAAPELVREAFKQLNTGRPRPVELEMSMDIMGQTAAVTLLEPVNHEPQSPDPDVIEEAAKMLGHAKAPLIVIGGGALDARSELLELAEMLQAPVVSMGNGRGVVSDRHYLSLSGPAGHRLWESADVVLAIGTRLVMPLTMWGTDEHLKIIRVDVDPVEIERIASPTLSVVSDARMAVVGLVGAVGKHNSSRPSREDELTSLKNGFAKEFAENVAPQCAFLQAIREELPDDGFFVDEVTQVGFASWYAFPSYLPRHTLSVGYQGTLGYGFATALGVQAGNLDSKVVSINGDGGFMFNVQEMATAVQQRLGLVTVVFNDSTFGNVRRQQKEWYGGRFISSDLHNPDFVKLAESFGMLGLRAHTPDELRQAIRRGFAEDGPSLIEVPVGEMPSPWPYILMPQVRPAH